MEDVPPYSSQRFLSLTVINTPCDQVIAAIEKILLRWSSADCFKKSLAPLDLYSLYEVEPPSGGAHFFKVVVFKPGVSSSITVVITNRSDGWNSLSDALSESLKCFQIQAVSSKDGDEYPIHRFQVWRDGISSRIVQALRDSDKWQFYDEGKIENFENPNHYKHRRISDRLSREILIEYFRVLGWDIADGEFWTSGDEAIYFEQFKRQ